MTEMSDSQAMDLIRKREIPEDIVNSGNRVAVVLTQDWCPQWLFMKNWLQTMEKENIKVFHISYNKKPYFQEFMEVKESEFRNEMVPYVRYYTNGQFRKDSNFVSRELFLSNFQQES